MTKATRLTSGFFFVNSVCVTHITVAITMPALPNRLGNVGTRHARDKKTVTVLDGLEITCYEYLMSSYCRNHISDYAPHGECRDCDVQRENEEEWVARIDFLKRKLAAADICVNVLRDIAPEGHSVYLTDYDNIQD